MSGPWHGWTPEVLKATGAPEGIADIRFARGFALSNPFMWMGPNPRAFGSGGAGGALAFADPDAKIGFGYAQNAHLGMGHDKDSRSGRVIQAIYEAL